MRKRNAVASAMCQGRASASGRKQHRRQARQCMSLSALRSHGHSARLPECTNCTSVNLYMDVMDRHPDQHHWAGGWFSTAVTTIPIIANHISEESYTGSTYTGGRVPKQVVPIRYNLEVSGTKLRTCSCGGLSGRQQRLSMCRLPATNSLGCVQLQPQLQHTPQRMPECHLAPPVL